MHSASGPSPWVRYANVSWFARAVPVLKSCIVLPPSGTACQMEAACGGLPQVTGHGGAGARATPVAGLDTHLPGLEPLREPLRRGASCARGNAPLQETG